MAALWGLFYRATTFLAPLLVVTLVFGVTAVVAFFGLDFTLGASCALVRLVCLTYAFCVAFWSLFFGTGAYFLTGVVNVLVSGYFLYFLRGLIIFG